MTQAQIAKNIKSHLTGYNISQVSRDIGVSRVVIYYWMRKGGIRLTSALKLAKYLKIHPGELLFEMAIES